MSCNSLGVGASPEQVFAVLDDAGAYARWVVGTRRIRAIDPDWPAPGSRFHHAVGNRAAELHDSTKVLARRPPRRLELEVRFRPTGVAHVAIDVVPEGTGSRLTLCETPTAGLVSMLPRLLTDPALWIRNAISLQRLRHEIDRRRAVAGVGTGGD
ncbi:MAG: SRPBCC family protein [Acidimicrobiia bacterium]